LIRDTVSDVLSGACGKHTADLSMRKAGNLNIFLTSSYADVTNGKSRMWVARGPSFEVSKITNLIVILREDSSAKYKSKETKDALRKIIKPLDYVR